MIERKFEFNGLGFNQETWGEFVKKVWFCNEAIIEVSSLQTGTVVIEMDENKCDENRLYEELKGVLKDTITFNRVDTRIIRQFGAAKEIQSRNPTERLIANGDLHEFAKGIYGYSGVVKKLMEYFDAGFVKMAEAYDPVEYEFPATMSWDLLGKCNYQAEFPQNLTFLAALPRNITGYNRYSQNPVLDRELLEVNGLFFAPTVCIHLYEVFKDKTLKDKICATAKGKCFRNEYISQRSLERLKEFWMREIIFIGEEDHVAESRGNIMDRTVKFAEEMGLKGRLEVATDPFFTSDYRKKSIYQKLTELKYELKLDVDSRSNGIAVASFNVHEDHFTKSFNIKHEKSVKIVSGCCAYGIERWVYAFLCQFGMDRSNWPVKL